MLVPYESFSYIKPETPCWKGEINLPLWKRSLVIGWQNKYGRANRLATKTVLKAAELEEGLVHVASPVVLKTIAVTR